ncbi:LysR family transcriptional regulator [Rhizobium sp. Root73]|uniref:LysR family transcriptional regulator n=1 Tax=unclassified Rhizobium TaxID=2613769 RepID=UPI000714068B|nr:MULTISPECIES: LysR family transcriptional regulator [unclassified Rhizobium]KQV36650.1 LysR family transcriptional regulator [Rhizobium sp. Root1204]KQY14274.1 LysR family transcriptional regulator [Rhizobium sp. Root1334]KRC06163.1 LysR family transcriptional regulator [Rhizobium sp. Root73]
MVRPHLPLNALRAFEASARHLSFTRAAIELSVTQAAVSHQVKILEDRLKVSLFKRISRGLMVTAEGEALLPVVRDSFDRMADMLERFEGGYVREVLTVGVIGTFAVGWLLPRLADFQLHHPQIELRLSTNNNRVDIAAEGLDFAIRFGSGAWHNIEAEHLFDAPLSAICIPEMAKKLKRPEDLFRNVLLRSYRADEWTGWFAAAGVTGEPPIASGIMFDSSLAMIEAALQGAGVALAPPLMFQRQLTMGSLQQPFDVFVSRGSYWLTSQKSRSGTPAMSAFRKWLLDAAIPLAMQSTGKQRAKTGLS